LGIAVCLIAILKSCSAKGLPSKATVLACGDVIKLMP